MRFGTGATLLSNCVATLRCQGKQMQERNAMRDVVRKCAARMVLIVPFAAFLCGPVPGFAATRVARDGVSFDVQPGRVTGFVGPNGAGKSTTMRMILGLD